MTPVMLWMMTMILEETQPGRLNYRLCVAGPLPALPALVMITQVISGRLLSLRQFSDGAARENTATV